MSQFKEKVPIFIFGLLFGLIIAGGFFILKLDDYFTELNVYKNVAETLSTFNNDDNEASANLKEEQKTQDSEADGKLNKKNVSSKTDKQKQSSEKIVSDSDSIKTEAPVKDSMVISNATVSDEIVIKKDELISAATLNLIQLNTVSKSSAKDSLLAKVSGVDADNNTIKMMSVEFWQSPLNFKGYKMSKYKIVLFGLKELEGIKIYKLDDSIILKSLHAVYQFDYTNEFKGYKQVTDEAVLNKLK